MDVLKKHQRKKKIRDNLYLAGFYTVLLFSFALLVVDISDKNTICFTSLLCADSKDQWLKASFILYLYFLTAVVVLIQTYKLLEKLIAKKNHITYFKYLLISLPFIISLIIFLFDGFMHREGWLLLVFTSILSVLGLLMIEFRKKP